MVSFSSSGMSVIGSVGLVYAIQAAVSALGFESERENILKSNLPTP